MAKKVTIEGGGEGNTPILNNLSDPWGGFGPATVNGIVVPDGTEWGMNRGEVERFIKQQLGSHANRLDQISASTINKIGYIARVDLLEDGIEQPHLVAFATEEDYNAWSLNHDDPQHQPLINFVMPTGGEGGGLMYEVTLDVQHPGTVKLGTPTIVNVKGTSIKILAGRITNINEELSLTIRTRLGANGTWTLRETRSITANSESYAPIDIAQYLAAGDNYVELVAIGNYASSLVETFKITAVSLQLIPNTPFTEPFTDTLEFNYLLNCNVASVLQFEFGTGLGDEQFVPIYTYDREDISKYWSECSRSLSAGGNMVEGLTFAFVNPARVQAMLSPGVHTLRARLYVDEEIQGDWIYSQYYVEAETPLVVVNNVQTGLSNWSNVHFFDWSASGPSYPLPVIFRLVNADNPSDILNSWPFNAERGVEYGFTTQLAIPDREGTIYATMLILDGSGTTEIGTSVSFVFSNNADFSPEPGAHFVLQPANRTNTDPNRDTIVNEGSGGSVTATFENFDFKNDGWTNVNRDLTDLSPNAPTYRALRIPAGRRLSIDYNPFAEFTGSNTNKNVTFEIDFRASNILNDDEPLLTVSGTHADGKAWGFVMLPTEAYLMTNSKRVRDDQNVSWAEDVRVHVAVNVIYNLGGLNYVRIFVNGVMDREFNYNLDDRFTPEGTRIVMGNSSSDLDIFGIRVNRGRLGTVSVMKDYRASLDSTDEKVAFLGANAIHDGNEINFADCLGKYNVIGYTGPLPKWNPEGSNPTHKGKDGEVMPSLYINIVGDEAHSGTLTDLEVKGQGTTAMTYHDWNQQYKITDNTRHIGLDGVEDVNKLGKGYSIAQSEPAAKKLVGKINFASSMQSHKLGLTWIYTEIFKRLAERNKMSMPGQLINNGDDVQNFPNARLSVYEKPFLFFHREDGAIGDTRGYEFKYLMTFGAGKGDKPTFGYDKNKTKDMLMVEGANNDRPLALFLIPWNEDVHYVTKAENSKEGEAWHYNNKKQINFGFGQTTGDGDAEEPSNTDAIDAIKEFFNFAYLHNTRIEPYDGTIGGLMDNVVGSANDKMYWVTQDDGNDTQYNLYRWSDIHNMWVDAGLHKTGERTYEVLNLRAQYETYCQNAGIAAETWQGKTKGVINNLIIKARRLDFMVNGPARKVNGQWVGYFHLNDALYHSCFVKFFAGTDNRAKNTYYYTDPVTLKIRWMQDDLDTTIKTNNVGQNRKPYYVEEHDQNGPGSYYWQGEHNGFYNLLEECYTWSTDIPEAFRNDNMASMMRSMLEEMASAGSGTGDQVMNYFLKRLLYVQDYFPAIAYNEQARKVYEVAAVAQASGSYTNNDAQAITQSCGSQRWSEYQWLKDRIMYISSWCEYGSFSAGTGFSWRGKNGGDYQFALTPAKYMYPRVGHDSGNYEPATNARRVRVAKGETLEYKSIHQTSDAQIAIRGIDHLLKIGDMNVPTSADQGTFSFMGSKLQEITVNPSWDPETDLPDNNLEVGSVEIRNATNIKRFIMHNVESATGELDLSKCPRLEVIDLAGSGFTTVTLPKTSALTELHLPAGLSSLVIEDCRYLATVDIEGVYNQETGTTSRGGNLTRVVVRNSPLVPILSIISAAIDAGAQLSDVVLENVNWQNVAPSMLVKLASVHATLTGTVSLSGSPTLAQKLALVAEYGNVDDPNNPLYITGYIPVEIASISISGEKRTPTNGYYQYTLNTNPTNGNNVTGVHWSISENSFATIDPDTGLLHVTGNPVYNGNDYGIITCEVTVGTGTAPAPATFQVGFFERKAEVGDLVYHDGTFGPKSERDANKTVIGVCFYSNDIVDGEGNIIFHDRRMISMNQIGPSGTYVWGPYNNASNGIAGFSNIQGVGSVYNVGQIPDIKNSNNWTVNRANYWQGEWPEGQFKYSDSDDYAQGNIGARETGPTGLLDAPANSYIPVGRKYTLEMIALRNKILNSNIWATIDSVEGYTGQATTAFGNIFTDDPDGTEGLITDTTGRKIPRDVGNRKEFAVVGSLYSALNTLKDTSGTAQRYGHLLFQAASMCYAYEPSAIGLANKFKAHNWYLPSAGEMCRIYWHMKSSCDGNAPFSGIADCAALHSDYMWTSGEYDNSYAWYFHGSSGVLTYGASSYKYTARQVRAACAF